MSQKKHSSSPTGHKKVKETLTSVPTIMVQVVDFIDTEHGIYLSLILTKPEAKNGKVKKQKK